MGKAVKSYKVGAIEATVFENDHNGKASYSITFQKSYKTKEGKWEKSGSFNPGDMPALSLIVKKIADRQVVEKKIEAKFDGTPNSQELPSNANFGDIPF